MEILKRQQLLHLTFDEFYNSLLKLGTLQKSPYQEHEMVQIMRNNLRASLAKMIFSAPIRNLGEFSRQVKMTEHLILDQMQHQ